MFYDNEIPMETSVRSTRRTRHTLYVGVVTCNDGNVIDAFYCDESQMYASGSDVDFTAVGSPQEAINTVSMLLGGAS